jgi:hypothetical protein
MTASQACNAAGGARCRSTGHGRARPDFRRPSQIVGQFMEFDANRRSIISRFTVVQLVASARSQSTSSSAALKSP